jgi:hypothetical protein
MNRPAHPIAPKGLTSMKLTFKSSNYAWQQLLGRTGTCLAAIATSIAFLAAPGNALSELLKSGDRSSEVVELQEKLNRLGYSVGVDGIFGNATEQAVRQYQSACGLSVDGIVGSDTRQALNNLKDCGGYKGTVSYPGNHATTSSGSSSGNIGWSPQGSLPQKKRYIVMIPTDNPTTLARARQLPRFFRTRYGYWQEVPYPRLDISNSRFGPFIRFASYEQKDKYVAEDLYRFLQQRGFRDANMKYEPMLK